MLGIEFKTFILEIVPFFEYGLKLQGQCIIDKLVLNSRFELFKQFYQFVDLNLVALHKLFLMPQHGPLETLIHTLCRLLNIEQ